MFACQSDLNSALDSVCEFEGIADKLYLSVEGMIILSINYLVHKMI